ncbi:hypothetical protein CYMTET_36037, partial [Cymbomonas tetramitiformis]
MEATSLYVLEDGKVTLTRVGAGVFHPITVPRGELFGEEYIYQLPLRQHTACTTAISSTLTLSNDAWSTIISKYPEVELRVRIRGRLATLRDTVLEYLHILRVAKWGSLSVPALEKKLSAENKQLVVLYYDHQENVRSLEDPAQHELRKKAAYTIQAYWMRWKMAASMSSVEQLKWLLHRIHLSQYVQLLIESELLDIESIAHLRCEPIMHALLTGHLQAACSAGHPA